MYAEIKSAIESVMVLSNILEASKDLRNFNELSSAVSAVNSKLMSATAVALSSQEKQSALASQIRQLEEENINLKNFETEAEKYSLQQIGLGFFAYVYHPSETSRKPRHWACANCFESRKIYTLQVERRTAYKCPNCGSVIEPYAEGQLIPIEGAYK